MMARLAAEDEEINEKRPTMKPFLNSAVKYFQLIFLFVSISSIGILMGEKGLSQKTRLEEKRIGLTNENKLLAGEIRFLERRADLLRTDRRTIEKAAKSSLGMSAADETVYMFGKKGAAGNRTGSEEKNDSH